MSVSCFSAVVTILVLYDVLYIYVSYKSSLKLNSFP